MDLENFENILKTKRNDIAKVIDIHSEPGLKKGENFMSSISRYTVKIQLLSGEINVLRLIVKVHPEEKQHTLFLKEFSYFKNEIQVYSNVLSKMKSLMEEFSDERDTLWCEMYGYKPFNQLMLEDLKDRNYVLMDRQSNLNYDHSEFVIKSLARFHAMSAVLVKRGTVKVEDFEPYTFAKKKVVRLFFWSWLAVLEKVVRNSWGSEWKHFADLVRNIRENLYERFHELAKLDSKRFNVLNHGDSWTNNLLFCHYEGTNLPSSVKFVDFQITHYNSFAWDLTYFMYTSILPEIRRENYDSFLKIYHKELSENLQFFKYPSEEIPKVDCIINEMKRIKFYGFLLLTTIYGWTTSETDDPYDLEHALMNEESPEAGIDSEIFVNPNYRRHVEQDLLDFMKSGIL